MAVDYTSANERIQGWGSETKDELIIEMGDLGIRHRANSQSKRAATQSLKDSYRRRNGLTSRVSYSIPKHMIYVHKGVGRGTPIEKVGQNGRRAKPWFNPVIVRRINALADLVAEEVGTAIMNNLLIK